jgi:hypothetical protein
MTQYVSAFFADWHVLCKCASWSEARRKEAGLAGSSPAMTGEGDGG